MFYIFLWKWSWFKGLYIYNGLKSMKLLSYLQRYSIGYFLGTTQVRRYIDGPSAHDYEVKRWSVVGYLHWTLQKKLCIQGICFKQRYTLQTTICDPIIKRWSRKLERSLIFNQSRAIKWNIFAWKNYYRFYCNYW